MLGLWRSSIDGLGRAGFYAGHAAHTLRRVNNGLVVYDVDGIELTSPLTHTAGYAGNAAILLYSWALFLVVAVDDDPLTVVDKGDNGLGAGLNADAAGRTFLRIDFRQSVFPYMYGIEGTEFFTGTEAEAAELAGLIAAQDNVGSPTILNAVVVGIILGYGAGTLTNDMGNLLHTVAGVKAKDFGYLRSNRRTAYGAAVYLGLTVYYRLGKAVATGVAAAAAVCRWQNFTNLCYSFIYRNSKFLRSKAQYYSEYKAHR